MKQKKNRVASVVFDHRLSNMIRYTYFFALFFIAVVVARFTHDSQEVSKNLSADCISHSVCKDWEKAQACGAHDWCKKQGIACAGKKYIAQGPPGLWTKSLEELELNCKNNYQPFTKRYGSSDLLDIKLQVTTGREAFTLSFDFKGEPTSEISKHGVNVRINDKLVYDDNDSAETIVSTIREESIQSTKHVNEI